MEELEEPSIGDSIRLLLKPVLLKLPDSLKVRVRQPPVGGVQISIPLQKVLTQLHQGSVKISFGELRQASPAGVFAELSDQDQTAVELPLAEILSQLKPEQLPRRAGQRKVEVPEAVSGLFDAKGQPLTSIRMGSASAKAPAAPAPVAPVPEAPIAPRPAPAVAFKVSTPRPPPTAPPAPIRPSQPLPSPAALRPTQAVPAAPVTPIADAVAPAIAAPTPEPQPDALPPDFLIVPLTRLTSGWPDAIKEALADLPDLPSLSNATVALPKDELEQALKRGKIAFSWKRIRAWIMPAPPTTTASELDDTPLDLPLPVIAPLFLAQRRPAPPQKQYTIGDHIPDLFAGKTLLDVANALTPAFALVYPNSSLAEHLQAALPSARVVKTLNTGAMTLMADPRRIGPSSVFLSGNDGEAKAQTAALLRDLGWSDDDIVDLGSVESARGPEHYSLLGFGLVGALKSEAVNIRVIR